MAVDLADYVGSLRREVTPPGSTLFATVGDDVFTGYLADAFWEARLDGFLSSWTADADGLVTNETVGGDDIKRDGIALVILYAGIKVLRNNILNTNTRFAAKAGPVEYETENSATMLAEMLKQLERTKDRLITASTSVIKDQLIDSYASRVLDPTIYGVL